MHWRRTWQPTPVFLPGETQGLRGLVGCRPWGLKSVFKDLGPKECETSVEHGAAGRQQVPRRLYPAAAAAATPRARVKGRAPALCHQEGARTTEGVAQLFGHRAPQDTPGSGRRLSS